MTGTPRPPSFLSSRAAAPTVRVAPFGAPAPARPALRGPAPCAEERPAGPTPEQLAALRAEAMQRVTHAVEVLRLQAERLAEQARADAIEIGFQVARRVLEAELSTSPEALFALVRGALKRSGDSRRIVVRLHPEDAKLVTAAGADQLGVTSARIEVAPDPSLEAGDCVVETDFGKVDGRLRTRLDELRRAVDSASEEGAA